MAAPRVGVVLSGCGVMDGSEIHEATLTLLAIDRAGAQAICVAPDVPLDTVDHRTGAPTGERRSVLSESARIARGNVRDIATLAAADLDALVFPGGFGAAKNLCTFAADGPEAKVHPAVSRLVVSLWKARKPIGVLCIAPAMLAACFRDQKTKVRLTIGSDAGTARAIEAMGCVHVPCAATEIATDEQNRIVSGPAYMLAGRISEVAENAQRLVDAVLRMAG